MKGHAIIYLLYWDNRCKLGPLQANQNIWVGYSGEKVECLWRIFVVVVSVFSFFNINLFIIIGG